MALDLDNFLNAFAGWLAGRAGVEFAGTPRALWLYRANEAEAADPYAILRPYGGSVPWVPVARMQVQCAAYGASSAAAFGLAQKLFNGLLDDSKRPVRMVSINGDQGGWRINGAEVTTPGILSVTETGKTQAVFNAVLRVVATENEGN